MGIVLVEICDGSLINEIDLESIIETEYQEVAVLESPCLSNCGVCKVRPYALVNGKRIIGKNAQDCLAKIREEIEKELAFYA